MATVNLKFNQLLMGVRSRVQGESKGLSNTKSVPNSSTATSSEGPKGLSISKVTSVSSSASVGTSSKKAEVVFSLKDFIDGYSQLAPDIVNNQRNRWAHFLNLATLQKARPTRTKHFTTVVGLREAKRLDALDADGEAQDTAERTVF